MPGSSEDEAVEHLAGRGVAAAYVCGDEEVAWPLAMRLAAAGIAVFAVQDAAVPADQLRGRQMRAELERCGVTFIQAARI